MKDYLYDVLHFSKGVRNFILTESMLGIGIGLYTLLLNLHLLAVGLNEAQIGSLSSMGTLLMGLTAIPCSILAGRLGRKALLVSGIGLMAVGYALFGAGQELWMFYAAQAFQALGLNLLITTEIQLLFYYSRSHKEETQAFSLVFAIFTLFMGAGTMLGGYIPGWIGGSSSSYQYTLYLAAGFLLACAFGRLLLLPQEQPAAEPEGDRKDAGRGWLSRMPGRTVWVLCGLNLLIGVSVSFLDPFLNIIIKYRLEWSDEGTSLLLTLNGIALFISSFLMPLLLDRWGITRTYRIVFSVTLMFTLVLAAVMPAGIFSVLFLVRGGSSMLLNNLILSHSMSSLTEGERNVFAGMRSVFRSFGSSAATFLAGIILAGKQYGLPFLCAAAGLSICFLYFELWVRPLFVRQLGAVEGAPGHEKAPETGASV